MWIDQMIFTAPDSLHTLMWFIVYVCGIDGEISWYNKWCYFDCQFCRLYYRILPRSTLNHILQYQANPMIRNVRGESSLDLASFYGRLETVTLLINEQPALLQQIQLSHSPLHLAARNGQKDVARKLLQSGYNINAKVSSDKNEC